MSHLWVLRRSEKLRITSLLHWWHCMNSISDATRWLEMDGNYCTWKMSSLAATEGLKKLLMYSISCALPKTLENQWSSSIYPPLGNPMFIYIYIQSQYPLPKEDSGRCLYDFLGCFCWVLICIPICFYPTNIAIGPAFEAFVIQMP